MFPLLLASAALSAPPDAEAAVAVALAKHRVTTEAARDYPACLAAVERGEVVYLVVGPYQSREAGDYHTVGTPMKSPPGRYKCWLRGGKPWMELDPDQTVRLTPPPAFAPGGS